ncbi:MAG TPA: hypothetical protein VG939_16970 [Caulobacteraceae bacterium]|nr:hypothetical protein [Caulobacteraceae bacterium]
MTSHAPFAISGPIAGRLDAVLAWWQDLRRGSAEVPFADDIVMPDFERLCPRMFLLEVFAKPERFRLAIAEVGLSDADRDRVLGRFLDEVDLPAPFEMLRAQASATVECMHPTIHVHEGDGAYQRLLLPAWGEGEVRLLLGAVQAV